ncbi:hypothetical protein D3C77_771120 [compost metagenome]
MYNMWREANVALVILDPPPISLVLFVFLQFSYLWVKPLSKTFSNLPTKRYSSMDRIDKLKMLAQIRLISYVCPA